MSFIDEFDDAKQKALLAIARESLNFAFQHQVLMPIDLHNCLPLFTKQLASFVTLKKNQQLRGCIGTLDAFRPLVIDVIHNAVAAACQDPRFSPVAQNELSLIQISISVLTPSTEMKFKDENDVLQQLRPGIDGLILEENHHRSTFLPAVWNDLPQPQIFLGHLKQKAGFTSDYWSSTLSIFRYETIYFSE